MMTSTPSPTATLVPRAANLHLRTRPPAPHAYCVPVVRELPPHREPACVASTW